jgi:hypothetical protein
MPSTYTPQGIQKMETGEKAGTWGTLTNTNWQIIEQIAGGYLSKAITSTPTTLAVSDGAAGDANEVGHRILEFTGSIGEATIVTIPLDVQTFYILKNSSSGAYTVQFKYVTGSGSSVTWAANDKSTKIVYATANDSTNPDLVDVGSGLSLTSPNLVTGINDVAGNELVKVTSTASAVNEITLANAASGSGPTISATGGGTDIDINITPKAAGKIALDGIKWPNADGSADQIMTTDGSGVLSFVDNSGGTSWQAVETGATMTAVAGNGYFIDTTSNACTATLPAGTIGDEVSFIDYAGTFDSNNLTVAADGSEKIHASTNDLTVAVERAGFTLVFTDSTQGWLLKDK